jgi:tryptophanyl-tRNA synthetase
MLLKKYQGDENVGVALLTYPVLMASDILLYQVNFVTIINSSY